MSHKLQRKFIFFLIVALFITAISFLYRNTSQGPADLNFKIVDGRQLRLEQYRDRPVLINFWATSCTYCIYEMPELIKLYEELSKEGLEIIGVAMPYNSPDLVLKVIKDLGINFPIALDIDGEAVKAFGGIPATPTHFLISPQGKIAERIVGTVNPATLRSKIEAMLLEIKNSKKI